MNRREFVGYFGGAATVAALTMTSQLAFGSSGVSMEFPWQIGPFERPAGGQPILRPNRKETFRDPIIHQLVHWEYTHAFNPAAIAWRGKLYVLYRAEDTTGHGVGQYTSRVGLAESSDGKHFSALPHPVLYPEPGRWEKYEWPGGCEDPRIVQSEDGTFVLAFTMWNRKVARLGVATSKDLLHWQHHGPVFRTAYGGRFESEWSKSGAIVTRKSGEQIVAARVAGKYWMYWHTDRQTALAYSHDLINWTPVLDRAGKPLFVLPKNSPGHFDSLLTESGPPALLTEAGIVFFYNGMSDGRITAGPRIPAQRYSAGQALFAGDDPARLLQRPQRPFFWPQEPWEKTGQYKYGTTFIEGLAWYQDKWFLFYGGADTDVGMAVAKAN
ncbi:MAG: glycoside hydrolase family 130 protein [Acidobacteria bacterium]|nr:glycoside hydrolase family 130 protein [Acidobacteriota bacterium]